MLRRRKTGSDDAPTESGTARAAALRLLQRRDYSVAELTTRLLHRGHDPEEVHEVVAALDSERLVDDGRVGRAHVRTSGQLKGRGRYRIRRELEARGLTPAAAEAALAEFPADDERAVLARLVERAARGTALDLQAEHPLFQRLLRRGFGADEIRAALAEHRKSGNG